MSYNYKREEFWRRYRVYALNTLILTASILSIVFAGHASAQSGLVLEEVVVTAQKRAQSVQDIPIAISALNATQLEESGFAGIEDLTTLVPSLQFGNFGPVTFLNVRGIGSENTTAGSDPGVALHIDGVYIGRPVGALFSAFDSERVEVLRGPQGTLYGRNATGGSVNLITKKPTDEFGGEVDVTAGDFDRFRLRGALNIPINDSASARIVAFNEDRDGFTDNTFVGSPDANDTDNLGVRGHLDLDLAENVSLLLTASFIESSGVGTQPEQRDPFATDLLFGPGPPPLRSIADANGPILNNAAPFIESKNAQESQENEFSLFAATLDWQFENFSIKAITSVVESEYVSVQDNDSSPADLQVLTIAEDSDQFTQEIQFISPDDNTVKWIVGLFYFQEDAVRFSTLTGPRFNAVQGFLTANVPGFNEPTSFNIGGDVESTSFAVFGQTSFNISDSLSITAGLRYTDDEKTGNNRNTFFAPEVVDAVQTDSQEVTGKFALDWTVSDSSLLYASFARGYKSGGISQTTVANGGSNPVFEPEFVDSFEVGYKSRLLEDRVQLNLSAYTSDYTDLQFQVFGDFGPEAGNAGGATINGLEIEFQALLSETWRLDANFAYTDAEYDELEFASGPGGVLEDFAGNKLPRVPETSFSLGITGEWGLAGGSRLKARLDGSFKDDVFFEFRNGPESFAESYENVNARVFWYSADDKFSVEVYATNLTDEIKTGNILVGFSLGAAAGDTGQEFTTFLPPRQVGVTLGYRF